MKHPSDIVMCWPFPLLDRFGDAEAELAGCLVVMALQSKKADSFLEWVEMSEIRDATQRVPSNIRNNPFLKPDIFELEARGYAELVKKDYHVVRARFTELGAERLLQPGSWKNDPKKPRRESS